VVNVEPFFYGGRSFYGGGDDAMFTLMPIFVGLGFIVILGLMIASFITAGIERSQNKQSPILTVEATVVTKRTAVRNSTHSNSDSTTIYSSSYSTYFVTFEVESGDRLEFTVPEREYGLFADGDRGRLTFQGTAYIGFERIR
jgi:hypothetical protein